MKAWESRCYSGGIPDEVSDKLMKSGRVPSYKAIALALLNNDVTLKSLGYVGKYSEYYGMIKKSEKQNQEKQMRLV